MSFAVLPKAKLTLQAPISEFWEDKFPKNVHFGSTLSVGYLFTLLVYSFEYSSWI